MPLHPLFRNRFPSISPHSDSRCTMRKLCWSHDPADSPSTDFQYSEKPKNGFDILNATRLRSLLLRTSSTNCAALHCMSLGPSCVPSVCCYIRPYRRKGQVKMLPAISRTSCYKDSNPTPSPTPATKISLEPKKLFP